MSIKTHELENPASCLNRSHDEEPLFVLCGRDRFAPEVVRYWAYLKAGGAPVRTPVVLEPKPTDKVLEALNCADVMEEWRKLSATDPQKV